MSEEQLKEIFGDDLPDGKNEAANEDADSQQHVPTHQTLEQWVEAGKDPAAWKTPEEFEEEGRKIKYQRPLRREMARQAEEFNRRLEGVNKLHRAQLEIQRNQLLVERDNAIDLADKTEVRRIDKELDKNAELQRGVADPEPTKPPEVLEWEAENPWIMDVNDPRTAPAIAAFTEASNAGKTLANCIVAADRAASKVNIDEPKLRRTAMPASDTPKARQTGGGKMQISMKDITSEEKQMRSFFNSDADFLKAVADSRS